MGAERSRRTLCWIAAAGLMLGVASELVIRLGWRDPKILELIQGISAGLNVGALVALALGTLGLALATRSAWWIAATVGLGLRLCMASVELLLFDPELGPPAAGLMALAGLTVVAAWACLGLATIARRRDGSAGLGRVAGTVVVMMALAFSGLYLGFSADEQVSGFQIVILDLGQALSLVGLPLLAAFLVSAAEGPPTRVATIGPAVPRGLATLGAVLMGLALGAIVYAAPIGWMASEATALVGLCLGCAGLILLGWLPAAIKPGPGAWPVAGLIWAAGLSVVSAVVFDRSVAAAWVAAGLSSLAMIAAGVVMLSSRGPAARLAWAAGGSLILFSAVGMTWAALGLNDIYYEVREVIRVLTTLGFLAGFCLTAVALLLGAGRPASGTRVSL